MEKKKLKNYLKLVLKIAISGLALFVVFRNIDWPATREALLKSKPGWLLLALIFFNFSKILSAYRLNFYFRSIDCFLKERINLRLYYVGMFYNLFLPGGIGGDGYKVYLLNKHKKTAVKPLVGATILDRVSGMVSLVFLALLLFIFSSGYTGLASYKWVIWLGLALCYPAFWLVVKYVFKRFLKVFHITNFMAFGVQALQVIAAFFILRALGVGGHFPDYITLFLISSVVAVFPFTIGGVGARELVMVLGYEYLPIDKNIAVAFSLLFFLITAVSSFGGAFLKTEKLD